MAAAAYRFVTIWRVRSTPERVSEILEDPCGLSRWWPEVYLQVREIEPGVFSFYTKGRLPYRLRWFGRETESRHPYGFSIQAWGDLEGSGVWTFKPDGDFTEVRYEWSVVPNKPLLRYLTPLLKPVFAANHRWAMQRGEKAFQKELERRFARPHNISEPHTSS